MDTAVRIAESVGAVLASTTPALAACGLAATALGLVVALAEHHCVLSRSTRTAASLAILLFLFYPRVILSSTILFLIGELASPHFAQSSWGFGLSSIPAGIGLSYLVFSLTIKLENYSRVSAWYLQNARGTRLPAMATVAAVPFHAWFSAVFLVTFSVTVFQGSMLGQAGPITVGVYLDRALEGTSVTAADRLVVVGTTLLLLAFFILCVPWLWRNAGRLAAMGALAAPPLARSRRTPLRRSVRRLGMGIVGALLVVATVLHLCVIARLVGLLPQPFEDTYPSFWPTYLLDALGEALDAGVIGALCGALLVCGWWFFLLTRSRGRDEVRAPLYFGIIAFLPSSFLGSLALELPGFAPTGLLLWLWGLLTSGALAALLVSSYALGPKLYRYDNLARARSLGIRLWYFWREYWTILLSLLLLACLFNAVDAGFRDQFGVSGLAAHFTARLQHWTPEERGLALTLCLLFAGMVLMLRSDSDSQLEAETT